jgi:hypothetical protein
LPKIEQRLNLSQVITIIVRPFTIAQFIKGKICNEFVKRRYLHAFAILNRPDLTGLTNLRLNFPFYNSVFKGFLALI